MDYLKKIIYMQWIFFLICTIVIYFFVSPEIIVFHFDYSGPTTYAPKLALFLSPLILFLVGQLLLNWAKGIRKREGLESITAMTPFESRISAGMIICTVTLLLLMLDQVGVTYFFYK